MTRLWLTVIVLIAILLVLFMLQNTEVVTVQFLILEVSMSRAVLILLTAIIGFVAGYITALYMQHARHHA